MAEGGFKSFSCKSPSAGELKHQKMYKMSTPPWKDSYRKSCKERLAANRQTFLEKLRNCASRDDVTTSLKNFFISECNKTAGNNLHAHIDENTDDLLKMFEEINGELELEELEILHQYKHYEELCDDEMINYMESNDIITYDSVNDYTNTFTTNNNTNAVLCPQTSLTLDVIEANLQHAMQDHSSSCPDHPMFSALQLQTVKNLQMLCKQMCYKSCNISYSSLLFESF
ncbi:hypothetical protein HELRODRAFT_183857 [Helobdella robusta]|uniref:RPA-interacting protein N-terminal domain-containing protein n=1 Tax=Helobdella robusta TaxID=6412 RepID=T1FK99_HELRO|nr:hypothetical protein HELRODRAFT_183857 [Helobdella robusta]ESO09764.1 hypothetical protein HELRODRAFT_183857 [Helobdella robusta]